MKHRIWWLLGIVLIGGGYFLMTNKTGDRTLRVAFPESRKVTEYEPTRIAYDYEYIFLENVFSPLVEMDAKGSVQPGVAEKAEWIGNELKLTIREMKTASGKAITVNDVAFSLMRLLVLSGNTHGNFKDIICPGVEIKSVEDNCPGMRIEGNSVYLDAGTKKSFLLPMLTAIDFAVIPKSSVDPKTLAIINFSETSGPYYVVSDDGKGRIELKLNPYHYFAAPNVAENIILIPTNSAVHGDSLRQLLNHQIDHITTIDATKADELLAFAQRNTDFNVHATMKIKSLLVVFTERGQKDLTPSERRYIGQKLRIVFEKIYSGIPGFEPISEFFPSLGEGGLTQDQRSQLSKLGTEYNAAPKKPFKLGFIKRGEANVWAEPINEVLPQAECYLEKYLPDLNPKMKFEDMPHAFIASTDTGFMEDINLISYSLNAGLLGLKKSERSVWLANYMALDDKPKRIQKLKELHFKALTEPAVVPLVGSPYSALVRKPWRMELSELFANNQLWRIKTH